MSLIDTDRITLPEGFFEKVDNVPKFYEWLSNIPTADAVEVVRCKHCKYHDFGKPDMVYCQNLDCFVSEEFFCKDGERSVEDGSAIIPSSRADKPDHS